MSKAQMAVESADTRGPSRPPMTPTLLPITGAVGVRVSPSVLKAWRDAA